MHCAFADKPDGADFTMCIMFNLFLQNYIKYNYIKYKRSIITMLSVCYVQLMMRMFNLKIN